MIANAYQTTETDAGQTTTYTAEMGKLLSFDGSAIPENAARRPYNYFIKRMMMRAAQRRVTNGNAYKVFESIVDHANSWTGEAWPALSTIADDTGLSEKVVRKALVAIEGAGVCKIQWSGGGRHGETHRFHPEWHLATAYHQKQQKAAQEKRDGRVPKRERTGAQAGTDGCPNGNGRVPKWEPNPYEDTSEVNLLIEPQKQDARAFADASAPAVRPCEDFQDKKPSGWDEPDWDDEFLIFLDRFNQETFREPGEGIERQGQFCGLRKRGFTLADMLVALEYDTKIANPYGAARSLQSFFPTYFGETVGQIEVQSWKDGLAGPKRKVGQFQGTCISKPVVPKAVVEVALERQAEAPVQTEQPKTIVSSYYNTPSMRREATRPYEPTDEEPPF